MRSVFTLTALAVLAGTISLLPTASKAQSDCRWYGATALRQQQENERLKCGYTGAAWHSKVAEHTQWCASVSPSEMKESAQQRDRMLAECAAGDQARSNPD